MNKSIDKCMGEGCACKLARKPVRILTDLKPESIIIYSSGPPDQPGFGGVTMQQALQMQTEASYRRRRLHEYMWGEPLK